jgi:hypothetical protein
MNGTETLKDPHYQFMALNMHIADLNYGAFNLEVDIDLYGFWQRCPSYVEAIHVEQYDEDIDIIHVETVEELALPIDTKETIEELLSLFPSAWRTGGRWYKRNEAPAFENIKLSYKKLIRQQYERMMNLY